MQNKLIDIFKSTAIVIAISAFGSLAAYLIHLNYIAAFILLFVIQYILFTFVGGVLTTYFTEKTKQKQLDLLEPLSTILECAFCNKPNVLTFLPNQNERIEFVCEKCKNKNLVNLVFNVARVTEPINVASPIGTPLVEEK
jgi:transcription elongation factor Elf1